MKILSFFLFFGVIFALLDPDPEFVCGSGSETLLINMEGGERPNREELVPPAARRGLCRHLLQPAHQLISLNK